MSKEPPTKAAETRAQVATRLAAESTAAGNVQPLPPSLPPTQPDMAAMLTALTAAITAGFASAIPTPSPVAAKKMSTSLDPYDTQSLDTDTKDGKYQWAVVTKMMPGWKLVPISVENADKFMDLLKDRLVMFGLDYICTVPTSGTGNTYPSSRIIAGVEHYQSDLGDFLEILKDIHALTLDQVRAFSGWFMGGESSTLITSLA